MEKRSTSPFPGKDRPLLAVVGVALVVSTALFAWSDRKHDWRWYQYDFRRQVTEKLGADRAKAVPRGVQQIWVPELRRADRCITCHQAILFKGFESAENPYRTHPAAILKNHPIEKYGCSSCHGGQGWAIDVAAAHAPAEHWEEPLLGSELGAAYSLVDDKKALLQMNCNVCHRFDRETPGAGAINLAKGLVKEKGCRACHVINGRGGTIGPDLTYVGDKAPEQYEYGRLSGQKSAFAWHVAHLPLPWNTASPRSSLSLASAGSRRPNTSSLGAGGKSSSSWNSAMKWTWLPRSSTLTPFLVAITGSPSK